MTRPFAEIPGPRGLPIVGMAPKFLRDPFGYAASLPAHGDVVRVDMGAHTFVYLFDPEDIATVLVHDAKRYGKGSEFERAKLLFRNGLVASDGDLWRRQRQRMLPAFHAGAVRAMGPVIGGAVAAHLDGWSDGDVRVVNEDMMALTLEVALQVLFGTSGGHDVAVVGRAFGQISDFFSSASQLLVPLPLWVPTPGNLRFRAAFDELERVVGRIIAERRAAPSPGDDLLGRLLAGVDDEGDAMGDQQLRDEVRTLLLAGHETTAIALAMALWLLADAPALQEEIAAEARSVAPHRPLAGDDVASLPAAERALREAMRLYPPVPIITREPREEVAFGGYAVPAGTTIILPPWVVQRDPWRFEDPLCFDPARWTPELRAALPRFAYFPFGGGPRVCIGMGLAMVEGTVALAEVLRRFSLQRADDTPLSLFPAITLRSRHPIRIRIARRASIP